MDRVFCLYLCVLCMFGVVFGDYDWESNPGDGTAGDPYQISTAEQLTAIGSNEVLLAKYFILTADIDLSAYDFSNSPIAPDTDQSDISSASENKFSGSLDGNHHRIYNLAITRSGTSYSIGLIGLTTGTSSEVKNLGLEDIDIRVGDSSQYLGGLVARGYGGTVSDSYVTGSITSGDTTMYMGGLIGIASSTHVSNCYVECEVTNGTGSSRTGGAIGRLAMTTGRLEKCYSIGIVDSESTANSIGALVGDIYNSPNPDDCYFLSTAGPDNNIGNARTAAQLRQMINYPNWEFNGPILGSQGHWRMRNDSPAYPYLAWEFMKGDFYGDFQVDLLDFATFAKSWDTDTSSFDFNWLCDLDEDGLIKLNDFLVFCEDWLEVN